MRSLYLALLCAGCATAGREEVVGNRPDGGDGSGSGTGKDAMVIPPADAAPLPDAPAGMQQVTLSQTNNMTLAVNASIACSSSIFGTPVATRDNSWYRVFKLSDYNITGPFQLQRVTFYTDYAYAGTGVTQPGTIKIGTYSGTVEADTLTTSSITPITQTAVTIPDADSSNGVDPPVVVDIAATIPAGSNLIVELALPDGYNDGNFYYIGVSAGGEMKKGYIRATPSGCNMTTPTALTSAGGLNQPTNSILMTVTGTK